MSPQQNDCSGCRVSEVDRSLLSAMQPLPPHRVTQVPWEAAAGYIAAPTSFVSSAPIHVVQGASTSSRMLAPSPVPVMQQHGRVPVASVARHQPDLLQATMSHQPQMVPVYAPMPAPCAGQFMQEPAFEGAYAGGFDEYGEDPQEQLQLGDEACNVVRSHWQAETWNTPPAALEAPEEPDPGDADGQFLALLESLEARVDLMSQMQQTRAAIQQRSQAVAEEFPSMPEQSIRGQDMQVAQNGELWDRVKDQEGEIRRLTTEIERMRQRIGPDPSERDQAPASSPVHAQADFGPLDVTRTVRPYLEVPAEFDLPAVVLPFCPAASGANLELSEDGYTATRVRGCRQSVAIGTGPLPIQEGAVSGRYFEISVDDTVAGWIGGLGIGVTTTNPVGLKRVPDKAWRVPGTMIVGYWGCVFLEGTEHATEWRSDTMQPGARVGCLVSTAGDLVVFVDGKAVATVEGALESPGSREALYPVVDVFAATRAVSLFSKASPPTAPWVTEHPPIKADSIRKEAGQAALETRDVGPA